MRFFTRGLAKSGEHTFDRGLRCNFTFVVAPDAVRKCEKPSMRTHDHWRAGDEVPEVVLVVRTNSACIREFGEVNVQRRMSYQMILSESLRVSMALIHVTNVAESRRDSRLRLSSRVQ